jgi:hypothetical protein
MGANPAPFAVEKVNLIAAVFSQSDGCIGAIKPAQATFVAFFFIQDGFSRSPITSTIPGGTAWLG